jgi:hypothetical protein
LVGMIMLLARHICAIYRHQSQSSGPHDGGRRPPTLPGDAVYRALS